MTGSPVQLRVGAVVCARDDEVGRVDALIVDPSSRRVTHLVLSEDRLAPRRLVPVTLVESADPDEVVLDATVAQVQSMEAFDEPNYNVPTTAGGYGELQIDPGFYYLEPYATPMDGWVLAEHERIPKDEVAIRRGADVATREGTVVGRVDEFLVDPSDGHVTHVVLRHGHVFMREDVVVPVHAATTFDDDVVRLDLTVADLEALPHIPVKRHHHVDNIDHLDIE